MPNQSPDQSVRQYIVSEQAVRRAFILGGIGMVAVIVTLLVMITSRPQGQLIALDDSQHQALLSEAAARLNGFELLDDGRARLDIAHAMQLVVERGVSLEMRAAGSISAPTGDAAASTVADVVDIDGAAIYARQCAACHQATGAGVPGAFPPLAGHIGELYAADTDYPIKVLLYGLMGPITVGGNAYNGLMPAAPQLSDAEIAALLNYTLTAWGDSDALAEEFTPYAADDVTALRGLGLTMADVLDARVTLALD